MLLSSLLVKINIWGVNWVWWLLVDIYIFFIEKVLLVIRSNKKSNVVIGNYFLVLFFELVVELKLKVYFYNCLLVEIDILRINLFVDYYLEFRFD